MSLFNVYPLFNITPVKGRDVFVYDTNNQKYLDLYGGHAVISIGHAHPVYTQAIQTQVNALGFYSNSVQNPLQTALATQLTHMANCEDYQLFLCNSGAEANENALKLASFHTDKKKVIAFKNSFHGRTSAAVAATDNPKIIAPINAQQEVIFIDFEDLKAVEKVLQTHEVCAVILETIQGVGGLDEASTSFYEGVRALCTKYHTLLIADEIQSGFGRTGDFFAFQKHGIQPDIISMAKGMGNGFPIGGILIHPAIKASFGLLGTTFGGNHLACVASLAVLKTLEKEQLLEHTLNVSKYLIAQLSKIPQISAIKGRGLMLGIEFPFAIASLRKSLLFNQHIFTGSAKNPNLLRILPPLSLQKEHVDLFIHALQQELKTITS
ncbi:Acetylornithine aminotransferase [Tenacibaculum sp. 190130A14a]|uniref:Acetylornithine aminotransferase n=1 Tax=Tenacibaculum polynesiense TaxID=3137857 RepID=A0ABP1F3B2_9FLAO